MIKGVIFDLDGVLVSTDEMHYQAWKRLADQLGIFGFTRKDNERQRGVSRMASLEIVLEKTDRVYTEEEKVEIAKQHLVPKQIKENGLKPEEINISEGAIRSIVNYYTREAGVRDLEREIGSVCRKVARKVVESGELKGRKAKKSDAKLKTYRITAGNI